MFSVKRFLCWYKLNALKGLSFSLQEYFGEIQDVDIIGDASYREANVVFDNVLCIKKSEGLGDTKHYPVIEAEDLKKLYGSFDTDDAAGLQEKVWFDVMFQLIHE